MLDVNLSAPARTTLHPESVAAITNAACEWLMAQPDMFALAAHVPALDLLFEAYLEYHDAELWVLLQNAMTRVNDMRVLEHIALQNLAALMDLNLRVWRFTNAAMYLDAARRLTTHLIGQFDAEREMFHADATGDANVFCVDANARIANALYRVWRALDDATARSIAGTVLGQVSDAFVAGEGLYQYIQLPDGERTDTQNVAAYASAIHMFLTATDTTGRGTYVSRAGILADFVLAQAWADAAELNFKDRAVLADALARLYSFARIEAYRNAAGDWLSDTSDVPVNENSASFALAIERYSGIVR